MNAHTSYLFVQINVGKSNLCKLQTMKNNSRVYISNNTKRRVGINIFIVPIVAQNCLKYANCHFLFDFLTYYSTSSRPREYKHVFRTGALLACKIFVFTRFVIPILKAIRAWNMISISGGFSLIPSLCVCLCLPQP